MKLIIKALIGSLIIHLIYFLTVAIVGFVKTISYEPNLSFNQDSASLPSTVTFGYMDTTNPYPFTFIGVAIIFFLILHFMYNVKKIA